MNRFVRILAVWASFAFSPSATAQCTFTPTINVDPLDPDNLYCPGDFVTLSTEAYSSYQWYVNFSDSNTGGTPIPAATQQSYLVDVSFWGFGYFYVEATDEMGCTEASATALIDSWAFLNPVIQSSGETEFCAGDSTEILFPSLGAFKFQWFRNGQPIPGATQQNYWVQESGTYTLEIAYAQCPELWLSSGVGPTFVFFEPIVPNVLVEGDTLSADSGSSFQWMLNGEPIEGANDPDHIALESGAYSVRVVDSNGCTAVSEPVEITITSVGETYAGQLELFPVPVRSVLHLRTGSEAAIVYWRLLDLQGRVLVERASTELAPNLTISLAGYPAGIYLIECHLQDGRRFIRRFSRL